MTDDISKPAFSRSSSTDETMREESDTATSRRRNSASVEPGEANKHKTTMDSACGKRKTVRRRLSKRTEPEYGNDTEAYEKIRERVLQERAVVNAIDALQERWRKINFLYSDCKDLNDRRRRNKLQKLSVQRQCELIVIIFVFILVCLPICLTIIFINR